MTVWKDEVDPLGPPADPDDNTPLSAANLNALEAKADNAQAKADEVDLVTLGTDWSTGTNLSNRVAGGGPAGQRQTIKHGTAASPVTTAGPTLKVSRTDAVDHDTATTAGESGVTTESSAGILSSIKANGTAAECQVCAIVGEAWTTSDAAGVFNDATALMGYARTTGPATGSSVGGYFEAVIESGVGTDSRAIAGEIRTTNTRAADSYVGSGPSRTMGVWICGGGSYPSACGIQYGGSFDQFDVGIGFNADAIISSSVRDDSDATRSLDIRGTHAIAAIEVGTGAGPVVLNDNYAQLTERTAPSAPAANQVRLYAVDNGGKTEIRALFNSGAAQLVAAQP